MPKVKVGEHYFLKTNAHVINEKLYFVKGLEIVLQQVAKGVTQVNFFLFEWLVIVIMFTFIMQLLILSRLFAKIFF
jgi:energy-converting hydrogenase Eha subunit F